jgi:UPF0716 protein FxsA
VLGRLFLLFAIIPMIEIYLLIRIGSVLGAFNTILLVLATAFAGAYLARQQGLYTLYRIRSQLEQGLTPAEEMLDAMIIFVAGLVLLTPGFVTDTIGLLLLFPPSRLRFKQYMRRKFDQMIQNGQVHIHRR